MSRFVDFLGHDRATLSTLEKNNETQEDYLSKHEHNKESFSTATRAYTRSS